MVLLSESGSRVDKLTSLALSGSESIPTKNNNQYLSAYILLCYTLDTSQRQEIGTKGLEGKGGPMPFPKTDFIIIGLKAPKFDTLQFEIESIKLLFERISFSAYYYNF